MKRITAVFLLICIVLLSSCSKGTVSDSAVALNVSGAEISDTLYALFLSDILQNPTNYSLSKDSEKMNKWIEEGVKKYNEEAEKERKWKNLYNNM